MRVTTKYNDEFRADALRLLRRGDRTIAQAARDLGVNVWTLRGWCKREHMAKRAKKASVVRPVTPMRETVEERVERLERENARLLKENEVLRVDRAILKKAAAFFAKESE